MPLRRQPAAAELPTASLVPWPHSQCGLALRPLFPRHASLSHGGKATRNPGNTRPHATLVLPRVPARVSEAIVLRTYPLKEADLVVSFFTRDQGKLRGVAKRARRPKSAFGAGLERLSHVRMAYFQRETRELVNLDSCELIRSQFDLVSDYWAAVALDYLAEVSEQLLPSAEPGERFFRLLLAVLESMRAAEPGSGPWRAVTYFSLWAVRLSGWLPELNVCLSCGTSLDDPDLRERAFFSRHRTGLVCGHCRAALAIGNTWELSAASRALAIEMLHTPVAQLSQTRWSHDTAADLRRFLFQQIESHAERRLATTKLLVEAMGGEAVSVPQPPAPDPRPLL